MTRSAPYATWRSPIGADMVSVACCSRGEQHGFRKAESNQRALEAELSLYAQVLGFERDDVPTLHIENL